MMLPAHQVRLSRVGCFSYNQLFETAVTLNMLRTNNIHFRCSITFRILPRVYYFEVYREGTMNSRLQFFTRLVEGDGQSSPSQERKRRIEGFRLASTNLYEEGHKYEYKSLHGSSLP
jgi:hypothetical protein